MAKYENKKNGLMTEMTKEEFKKLPDNFRIKYKEIVDNKSTKKVTSTPKVVVKVGETK